jgi:hypothetical protein
LRDSAASELPPVEKEQVEAGVAEVRTALGEEAFAVAWAAGRALPTEQAVAYAIE